MQINANLATKRGGWVIWMWFDQTTLKLGPFYWFGHSGSELLLTLGERVGRHTKANAQGLKAERPNIRLLGIKSFDKLCSMREVAQFDIPASAEASGAMALREQGTGEGVEPPSAGEEAGGREDATFNPPKLPG